MNLSEGNVQGNILVVDDTPENLHLLIGILTEHGYDVRPAPDGDLALRSVQSILPDVILLDIKMPDMDGYTVCEQLKANPATRDIPVIFISALNEVTDKVKGFAVGGVDYLTKPFQAEEVVARVQTHLTLYRLQQSLQKEIAERTRTEAELQRYREHLEELVKQRTAELRDAHRQLQEQHAELQRSHDALQKANTAIEAAHRVKSEFIANISHEVRTPMNGIMGFTQLLRKTRLTEQQQEALKVIHQCGENLLVIIDDILDIAILEADQMALESTPFRLVSFLAKMADMIRFQAESKELRFQEQFAIDLPEFIRADPKRLRQILLNLLGNAVKFTATGSVTFKVTSVERPDQIRTIRFEIEDTGMGIPPDQLTDIFEAFHQIGSKFRAETRGIGLGLTVSQRLTRMMGSELHVQSALGAGSLFWFDLDAHAADKRLDCY